MSIERVIGIDFGTSTSVIKIKTYKDNEPMEAKEISDYVRFNNKDTLPTLVYKTNDNDYLVGYEAENAAVKGELHQNFKLNLISENNELKNEAVFYTKVFFEYIYKVYDEQRMHFPSCDIETTYISYPAKWSEELRLLMIDIATKAGFRNVIGIDEPTAAIHTVMVQKTKEFDALCSGEANILMIDMGAGTTDIVLCRYDADNEQKITVLNTWPKMGDSCLFGGREVDERLCSYVRDYLISCGLPNAKNFESKYLDKCKTWKETNISPTFRNNDGIVKYCGFIDTLLSMLDVDEDFPPLDRKGFEQMLSGYIEQFSRMINGCIDDIDFDRNDIDFVILTGGHSQWYFISDIVEGALNQYGVVNLPKIVSDKNRLIRLSRPQETVALGMVYQKLNEEEVKPIYDDLSSPLYVTFENNTFKAYLNSNDLVIDVCDVDVKNIIEQTINYGIQEAYKKAVNIFIKKAQKKLQKNIKSIVLTTQLFLPFKDIPILKSCFTQEGIIVERQTSKNNAIAVGCALKYSMDGLYLAFDVSEDNIALSYYEYDMDVLECIEDGVLCYKENIDNYDIEKLFIFQQFNSTKNLCSNVFICLEESILTDKKYSFIKKILVNNFKKYTLIASESLHPEGLDAIGRLKSPNVCTKFLFVSKSSYYVYPDTDINSEKFTNGNAKIDDFLIMSDDYIPSKKTVSLSVNNNKKLYIHTLSPSYTRDILFTIDLSKDEFYMTNKSDIQVIYDIDACSNIKITMIDQARGKFAEIIDEISGLLYREETVIPVWKNYSVDKKKLIKCGFSSVIRSTAKPVGYVYADLSLYENYIALDITDDNHPYYEKGKRVLINYNEIEELEKEKSKEYVFINIKDKAGIYIINIMNVLERDEVMSYVGSKVPKEIVKISNAIIAETTTGSVNTKKEENKKEEKPFKEYKCKFSGKVNNMTASMVGVKSEASQFGVEGTLKLYEKYLTLDVDEKKHPFYSKNKHISIKYNEISEAKNSALGSFTAEQTMSSAIPLVAVVHLGKSLASASIRITTGSISYTVCLESDKVRKEVLSFISARKI